MSSSEFSDTATEYTVSGNDSVTACFTDENICGTGASCVVYQMRIDGLKVAVKRLRREFISHPAYVASYRKEYAVGVRLKHLALPTYRQLIVTGDDIYIVMEYIDGIPLDEFAGTSEGREYLENPANVRKLFSQLVDVVGYLHRSGVMHCDIKPGNIMIRRTDRSMMLIDLDKCYSDTLDLTHGGTRGASEPLPDGAVPVVRKDLLAIGSIYDFLVKSVAGFPVRKFVRFRKACEANNVTAETLQHLLEKKRSGSMSIVLSAIIVGLAIVGISYLVYNKHDNTDGKMKTMESPADNTSTHVATPYEADEPSKASITDVNIPAQESGSEDVNRNVIVYTAPDFEIDIDGHMTDFFKEADAASAKVKGGGVSVNELDELSTTVSTTYGNCLIKTKQYYKDKYKDKEPVDVEFAINSATIKSRSYQKLVEFATLVTDSISK